MMLFKCGALWQTDAASQHTLRVLRASKARHMEGCILPGVAAAPPAAPPLLAAKVAPPTFTCNTIVESCLHQGKICYA